MRDSATRPACAFGPVPGASEHPEGYNNVRYRWSRVCHQEHRLVAYTIDEIEIPVSEHFGI